MATLDQIKSVRYGTETGNRPSKVFAASFAVPDDILAKQFRGNYSGLSFGSNQLDLGNNPFARQAYQRIINNAFESGAISDEQKTQLLSYSGLTRPDMDFVGGLDSPTSLLATLQPDRQTLNGLFATPYARNEIVKATNAHIATQLNPINNLLDRATAAFQDDPNSIFNPTSADYNTAVAAVVAAYNRNPQLANRLVTNLEQHVRVHPMRSRAERSRRHLASTYSAMFTETCMTAGEAVAGI